MERLSAYIILALLALTGPAAAQTIPQLPAASAVASSDLFEDWQAGSHKVTSAQIQGFILNSVVTYGAHCNGTTDDTAAILSAATVVNALGGGVVQLCPTPSLVGTSEDLDLRPFTNVVLQGAPGAVHLSTNLPNEPYTLLLSSAHTIDMGNHDALVGVRIARRGIATPTTLRGSIQQIAAFAGTGVSVIGFKDVLLRDVQIDGFAQGINAGANSTTGATPDRLVVDHVAGDDTAFLALDSCADTCTITDVESFPFTNTGIPGEIVNVSAASSDGGLIELTLASAAPTPLVTGDTVIVGQVGGTTEANARWVITVIDSTHLTLNGSTFVHPFTSGGFVYLQGVVRTGIGLSLTGAGVGGEMVRNYTDFGHDTSLFIGPNHGPGTCVNCWLDGDSANGTFVDTVPTKIMYEGLGWNIVGAFLSSAGHSIIADSASSRPLNVSGSTIGTTGCIAGAVGAGVTVETGSVQVTNSSFLGGCSTSNFTLVDDGAVSVNYAADFTDSAGSIRNNTSLQSGADCPKVQIDGLVACGFTPTLVGTTTAGTPTYSTAVGTYTISGEDQVTVQVHLILSALGGIAGNLVIEGLPVAAGDESANDGGSCAVSRWGDVTFPSGFASVVGQVSAGQDSIALGVLATTTSGPEPLTTAMIGATFEVQLVCAYHQ
jgi:hypothetical protein